MPVKVVKSNSVCLKSNNDGAFLNSIYSRYVSLRLEALIDAVMILKKEKDVLKAQIKINKLIRPLLKIAIEKKEDRNKIYLSLIKKRL